MLNEHLIQRSFYIRSIRSTSFSHTVFRFFLLEKYSGTEPILCIGYLFQMTGFPILTNYSIQHKKADLETPFFSLLTMNKSPPTRFARFLSESRIQQYFTEIASDNLPLLN